MVQQMEWAPTAKKSLDVLSKCLAGTPEKDFNQGISNSKSSLNMDNHQEAA